MFKYYIQNINNKKYFTAKIGQIGDDQRIKGYIWSEDFKDAKIFEDKQRALNWVMYDMCFSYAKVRGKHFKE